MHLRIVVAGAVAAAVLGHAAPAWAKNNAGGYSDGSGIGAEAGNGSGSAGGGSGGGGGKGGGKASPCTPATHASDGSFVPGTSGSGVTYVHHPTELIYASDIDGVDPHQGEAGAYYDKLCNGVYMDTVWIPQKTPAETAADLADEAYDHVPLPDPVIHMSPDAGQDQLVGLRTYLWVDAVQWQPATAQASVPGIVSTVVATPKRVVWKTGTGDTVTCNGPGTPYNPAVSEAGQDTSCSYVYPRSSAGQPNERFTVIATVVWEVAWSAPAAGAGGPLPAIQRSSSVEVRVAEVQALNTTTS